MCLRSKEILGRQAIASLRSLESWKRVTVADTNETECATSSIRRITNGRPRVRTGRHIPSRVGVPECEQTGQVSMYGRGQTGELGALEDALNN